PGDPGGAQPVRHGRGSAPAGAGRGDRGDAADQRAGGPGDPGDGPHHPQRAAVVRHRAARGARQHGSAAQNRPARRGERPPARRRIRGSTLFIAAGSAGRSGVGNSTHLRHGGSPDARTVPRYWGVGSLLDALSNKEQHRSATGTSRYAEGGPAKRPGPLVTRVSLQDNDVGGAVFAALLYDVKLHALAFSQRTVAARLGKCGEVDEHVLPAALLLNEAVALRVVKPLDGSRHLLSFLPASQRHVKRQSE